MAVIYAMTATDLTRAQTVEPILRFNTAIALCVTRAKRIDSPQRI